MVSGQPGPTLTPTGAPKKTLALDFDGVLHGYSRGWQDGRIYDPPVCGAASSCRVLAENYKLVVYTAREDIEVVCDWLKEHGFPEMEVTNRKPPAWAYIDDRAIAFRDWATCLQDIETFSKSGP